MEGKDQRSDLFLSWIEKANKGQARWILGYLSKRKARSDLASYLLERDNRVAGQYRQAISNKAGSLEDVIQERITDSRSQSFIQSDLSSRELMRSMRGAWYQKRYRESHAKLVSFQLPKAVVSEVERIARHERKSRTQVLEEMISDAAALYNCESERSAQRVSKLSSKLKKSEESAREVEDVLRNSVDTLLRALAREADNSCNYEAASSGIEGDSSGSFNAALQQRAAEVEALVPGLKLFRGNIRPVKEYFADYEQGVAEG